MNQANLAALARRLAWPLALLTASAVAGSLAAQKEDSPAQPPSAGRADRVVPGLGASPSRGKDEEKLGERLREGTRLNDVLGSFQFVGDRVAFHPDGKGESYRVLENLALERIGRVLGEARGTPTWTVSGVVTEFRGSNFLLVAKAVVKSAGDSPSTAP